MSQPDQGTATAAPILVWDLPVRLFHLAFAGSCVGAFAIGQLADDDGALFPVHMLLGGIALLMVPLRILWGFVGPKYARFGSFVYGPAEILAYVRGALSGTGERRYLGHNPGSSLAIFALLALGLALPLSGALMSQGELFEELHEVLAYALAAVVCVHVAGVAFHTVRHREGLVRSMIDGRKAGRPEDAIPSAHPAVGLVFLALVTLWGFALVRGYDPVTQRVTLPVIGQTLQLGEGEGHQASHDDHDDD